MEKITVLMSTYNGEAYISAQIKSILAQKEVNVSLEIRDDGSTDHTVEIIRKEFPDVHVQCGKNVGYKKSFMILLQNAPVSGYYAFADQDDVWLENKLAIGVNKIRTYENIPAFYCSNLKVVDENLNYIRMLHSEKENIHMSQECALVENISYGCTLVFNQKLREIAEKNIPEHISHDGWLNLIGLYFGKGIYDEESYILYRQHGNNILGGDRSFINTWRKRMRSFRNFNIHSRDIEAQEFLETFYMELSPQQIQVISSVAFYRNSILNKLCLLVNKKIKMTTFDRDFWYRVRIICSNI